MGSTWRRWSPWSGSRCWCSWSSASEGPAIASLSVTVTPRAAADRVRFSAGTLKVWISRPPVEGEANRAVIRLVARALRVAPSSVALATGERSRHKRLVVAGLSDADLAIRLADLGD